MKIDYYKCINVHCKKTVGCSISDIEWKNKGFPEKIKCAECGFDAKRIISPKPSHVKAGKAGNYKNSYTSSSIYIKKT